MVPELMTETLPQQMSDMLEKFRKPSPARA
jgi:hypothetical protein